MRTVRGEAGIWLVGSGSYVHLPDGASPESRGLAERRLNAQSAPPRESSSVYSATILTTTRCNLTCAYCFQSSAEGRIRPARISEDNVEHALSFIERDMVEQGADSLRIHLFGGEPLLAYRECATLLERARAISPGVRGSLQTNFTLMTRARLVRLASLGLEEIHVTFDGGRAEHDRLRTPRGGSGSYDTIMRNLKMLNDFSEILLSVRVNVSGASGDGLVSLVDDLIDALPGHPGGIYFAPVRDYGAMDLDPGAWAECATAMTQALDAALSAGWTTKPPADANLSSCEYCGTVGRQRGCIIDPGGYLYSCWDSAGRPELAIGDVLRGRRFPRDSHLRWTRCGDGARDVVATAADIEALNDHVDAYVLDWMRANGSPWGRRRVSQQHGRR